MSSVSGSSASSSSTSLAALQQAAQSIINGSTGNSALDVNSLVTTLVNSKIAGQSDALSSKTTIDNNKLSALGALSTALSALQAGLKSLSDGSFSSILTTSSSGKGITASAGKGAVAGSYSVAVKQIATAQSLVSSAFSSTQTLATSGTLTLSLGSKSMAVSIDSSDNTLSGIAKAINSAAGNPGITATVVTGTDGQHLVLNSKVTGAANVIDITASGVTDDQGLSSLAVTSTAPSDSAQSTIAAGEGTWTQASATQDAELTIGSIPVSSASNTIDSAVSGITLTLTGDAAGTTQTVTVAQDTSGQAAAITNFVTLYNAVVKTVQTLTAFTPHATSQGPLLGDSTVNQVSNTLATIVSGAVQNGSSKLTLAGIGLNLQADGSIVTDTTVLNAALTSKPGDVAALFNATNGVGATMNADITAFVQKKGLIDNEQTSLNADLDSIQSQAQHLTDYAAQLTTQYSVQFTALNSLMAKMNSNSQYLTQLFGGANSSGALAAGK